MRILTLLSLVLLVAACQSGENPQPVAPSFVAGGPPMDKLPDHVKARLEKDQIDVAALEQLISSKPENVRKYLRTLISDEQAMWGLSAPEGTPESILIDRAFEKVKDYRRINKK